MDKVKKVIGEILTEMFEALKKLNVHHLRVLSRKALEYGAINENKDLIDLAVALHALSKVTEKEYYRKVRPMWRGFLEKIKNSIKLPAKEAVKKILEEIEVLDSSLGRYAEGILHRSRIRIATTLYAWGMSLGVVSDLTGVAEAEVLKQVGSTKIVDEEQQLTGVDVKKRLETAEEIL